MNKKPNILCISQARMTSTRLPGKVMLPILGRPLLAWHIDRLRQSKTLSMVAVATVDAPDSAPIVDLCRHMDVPVTLGDEQDVLGRFHACAAAHDADVVVRVTSDCPLIDPHLLDQMVGRFLQGDTDYVALDYSCYPRGVDVEVFSRAHLDQAFAQADTQHEREHVTPYLYTRDLFRVTRFGGGEGAEYRLCVDQPQDYQVVCQVAQALAPLGVFGWRDMVNFLRAHPQIAALNCDVQQKALGQ